MPNDFYELLGVSEDATQEEVKAAWRQKAREYHPDLNDDVRAGSQFKTIKTAYEVLSDRTERRAYDRLGHERYVETRLDGLPTGGMSGGTTRWSRGAAGDGKSSSSGSSSRQSSGSSSRQSSGSSSRQSSGSSSRQSSGSSSRQSSGGSSRQSSGGSSRQSSRKSSGTGPSGRSGGAGNRARTNASASGRTGGSDATSSNRSSGTRRSSGGRGGDPGATAGTGTNGAAAATADGTAGRTRSPLWYGWFAVLAAALGYAAGLGAFWLSNADAIRALAASLAAAPTAALASPSGLAVTRFAAAAVENPGVDALFVAGVVVLPAVLLLTVKRFGHGTAWLYPLAALGPALAVLGGPYLPPLAAVDLVLLLVLPIVSAGGFLVDVGRFLFAST